MIGRNEHGEPIFAPECLEFARHYGFTPQSCRPYRAQTKGKVERPVRHLRENFLPRLSEEDVAAGCGRSGQRLQWWIDEVADVREHGTTLNGRSTAGYGARPPLPPKPSNGDPPTGRRN